MTTSGPAPASRRAETLRASAAAAPAAEPVLLIIADISGYTRYMTANAKTLAHSQTIITELVKAIIHQVELPLEVAKLEGDAVFLFCRKRDAAHSWSETRRIIGEKLLTFFRLFSDKVRELSQSTTCTCNACTHIEKLRLKVVVHSGEALFHRVFNFLELAGVDVIIVHRLLKNSITADQYLLLTEAAHHDVEFAGQIQLVNGSETYDDIGRISTLIFLPDGAADSTPGGKSLAGKADEGLTTRFGKSWRLLCKLWFAPFFAWSDSRRRAFRHVTTSGSPAGRFAFAVLTLLLTPIFLPVGFAFALVHALKQQVATSHSHNDHEHKPDGSCCATRQP